MTRFASALAALTSALLSLRAEAQGEEIGGVLTAPFDKANSVGAAILLATAAASLLRPRLAHSLAAAGSLLVLPMQTWRLFPGLWCAVGNCAGTYPAFVLNTASMATLVFCSLAVALTFGMRGT